MLERRDEADGSQALTRDETGEQLYELAREAQLAGRLPAARALLRRARARAPHPDLHARIEISLAYVLAETGTLREGIDLCTAALGRADLSVHTQGLGWSQLALLRIRGGETDQAFQDFSRAVPLLEGHHDALGTAFINRGNLYLAHGRAEEARSDLNRAYEEFKAAGTEITAAKAQHNLGYAHLLKGDLVAALTMMEEASTVLAPLSPMARAVGEQDRAEVLVAAGRSVEASKALEDAIAAYGEERLRRFQAECELVLARTILSEDPARAKAVARRAARRFSSHGSEGWSLRARAVAVMAEVEAGANRKKLVEDVDALASLLVASGHRQDADRLALHAARIAVRRDELADAASRLRRVRTTEDSPITTRILARELRAELAAAQGQTRRSAEHARKGLADLAAWQATFGSLDLQTSAVGHGQHLARLGLRAAMTDGRPAMVFDWSERARALASRVTSLRPPPDPELAADLTALRMADPTDLTTRRELRERIRAHSWFSAQGTVGEPAGLAELQARLAIDDSALVAHIVLDGTITALAVTATEAQVVPLAAVEPVRTLLDRVAADLDFAAQNRSGEMAAAVRASLRADLAAVADLLIRPVLATIGYRRLVLTPSALLTGCPWTALPGLIGRPVTVPTSATQWLERAQRPLRDVREVGLLAGPRLERAEEEVRRAATSWPQAQVLAGDEADSARAGWLAARVDLLHVAGHGSHLGDHPLFSAVELADGPWFGHDIDLLPRVPDVVVLSACDLGQASVVHSEESLGMSAVWQHAGARAVVSSLALLPDDLACEVFASWHELVAAGAAPADALAQVCASTDEVVPLLSFGAGW